MRRAMLLCAAALGALPGCAEETFETPPDCSGRKLVVYARQPALDQADIYLYDFENPGFHLLPGLNSTTQRELDPAITHDDRFIAAERVLAGGDVDIVLYDRCQDAILPQPGLNTALPETDPAFSQNGLRLAFARDTLGRREIRLYDGAASMLVPLPGIDTTGTYLDSSPALDVDGDLIAFVSTRRGTPDVLVYDALGDSLLDVPELTSASSDLDPSITPDGKYLVFASDRPGGLGDYDLYLFNLQTRTFVPLADGVNSPQAERHPSIEPGGDRIVFETDRTGADGGSDLWITQRSASTSERAGASSATLDVTPYLVWR